MVSIIAVDTGGTFTDIVFLRDGLLHVQKVPSTPDDPARAVIEAVNALTPRRAVTLTLVHGSTVATNALLERRGARVALITNCGFEDIIEIGRQNRPRLYALSDQRAAPLVAADLRFGIAGRVDHAGREIEALAEDEIVALEQQLAHVDAIAICLLHSYANDAHERRVAQLLSSLGKPLSVSSEVLPEYREYERTATTVVNAYIAPLMVGYLARLELESGARRVRVMGSAGGAVPVAVARREPVHTVLSGPAGGVAGALAVARADGIDNIISFDMGGTSTDVSICPGGPLFTRDFTIGGTPVAIPVLDIHTVGAGGGSIAWVDAGGLLRVGPRSAGAVPGPICYGRGGVEVTVTDAHVWLGRLPADAFLGGRQNLDRAAIGGRLAELAQQLGLSNEVAAAGIITIADSTMEGALRVISVERGYDPVDFTLIAFGGAAGLHAAELAQRLGMPRVLLPFHPGVLSAFGMLAAPVRKSAARTVLVRSDVENDERLDAAFADLAAGARTAMLDEGIADSDITISYSVDARYHGQSHELRVAAHEWIRAFHAAHARRYGYANEYAVVEAVTARVDATAPQSALPPFAGETMSHGATGTLEVWYGNSWRSARVQPRHALDQDLVDGPAIITDYSATTWVPEGWQLRRLASGALSMDRA